MTTRKSEHRAAAVGLAALACLAPLAVTAAGASAATYHAYVCKVPYGASAGAPASTDNILLTHNSATGSATQSCTTGGPMTASLDGSVAHAHAEGAAVIYTTPTGLTLSGFAAWRHEAVAAGAGNTVPFTNVSYTGVQSAEGGTCQQNGGCFGRGDPSSPFAAANVVAAPNLSGVTEIRFDAFCGGEPGGTCPAIGPNTKTAVINVFAADMLLNDATAPAVSGVGGPLLSGQPLTGVQSVSFKATDAGSGVHKASLVIDGTVVGEKVLDDNGGACADLGVAPDGRPSFANSQPCLSSLDGALALNTDLIAPGTHELVVRVADAAGNVTQVTRATIATTGPRAPGTNNGTGASRLAKLSARFGTRGSRTRRLAFTARPTITGRLVDEAGNAITGATIDIVVRERRAGAATVPIASATTGADGAFRVQLPSGPSRTIAVGYVAFAGDLKPAASAVLRASVRASLSASISPRSPRLGQPLRLSGRLRHLPRRGVDVAIQARDGRVWRTVDTVKTGAGGRFSWPYRFRSAGSAGRTYVFRARVSSGLYPFAAGNSRTIRVRVRR